jgi:hypothetical protein
MTSQNIVLSSWDTLYINSTNILPIMIINRIYEIQNLLSLYLFSFLVRLRTYRHPCTIVNLTLPFTNTIPLPVLKYSFSIYDTLCQYLRIYTVG